MSRHIGPSCVKCGAPATSETAETDEPMCWAHGGGEPYVPERDDTNYAEAEEW
jgi:hypothetical protein